MSGTWLKTLDGADVYTTDHEWWWSPHQQGWFHDPALLAMPEAPMGVRLREEGYRLTHGWPSLRSALFPRKGEHVRGVFSGGFAWLCRAYLAYAYIWTILLHLVPVTKVWVKWWGDALFIEVLHHHSTGQYDMTNSETTLWAKTLILVWLSWMVMYLLYEFRVYDVDIHKGNLMAGAVVGWSMWRGHERNPRARDQRFARDVAAELDRRHQGGYGGGLR